MASLNKRHAGAGGVALRWLDVVRGPVFRECFGSIAFSVILILVNKHIFSGLKFRFVLLTTALHFIGGFILMSMFRLQGWFEAKRLPRLQDTVWVAACSVASIASMNMNLGMSSVGFYQVTKLAIIPSLLVVNFVLKGQWGQSPTMVVSLLVMSCGLALATVHDVSVSLSSFAVGATAVCSTCAFQVGIQNARQAHGLSPLQLQYEVSLPQAIAALALAVPVECFPPDELLSALRERPVAIPVWVTASILLAMCASYYAFAVVGRLSAITYQVVNHAKTCLVLTGGLVLFPVHMSGVALAKHIAGLVVAIAGVFWYSVLQSRQAKANAANSKKS